MAASPRRKKQALLVSLMLLLAAWIAFAVHQASRPHRSEGLSPLLTRTVQFDPAKVADLVVASKTYGSLHAAHLGYYWIAASKADMQSGLTEKVPAVMFMATLEFEGGFKITMTNPDNRGLEASLYSGTNTLSDAMKQAWSDFVPFFDSAVAHANATPDAELPKISSNGEGGKMDRPWWDWRFHAE